MTTATPHSTAARLLMGPPRTEVARTAGLTVLAASSRNEAAHERVRRIVDPIGPSDALDRARSCPACWASWAKWGTTAADEPRLSRVGSVVGAVLPGEAGIT